MLVRESDYRSPSFWASMWVVGTVFEVVVLLSAFAADRLDLLGTLPGHVLFFVLGLCMVYLGAQVLQWRHSIPTQAGMSLSLLAGMLAWLGSAVMVAMVVVFVGSLLFSFVWVPSSGLAQLVQRRVGMSR